MKEISIKAIIIGLVTLIVLDTIFGMLLINVFVGELTSEAAKEIQSDILFLSLRILVGALALIAAGYIVENIAKKTNLINSGVLGVISIGLTVLALGTSYPLWYLILSYCYQFPSAIFGGKIYHFKFDSQNDVEED